MLQAPYIPFLGVSAGAVVACPSIRTSNDMPVVDPGGLDALGLVDFQVNLPSIFGVCVSSRL